MPKIKKNTRMKSGTKKTIIVIKRRNRIDDKPKWGLEGKTKTLVPTVGCIGLLALTLMMISSTSSITRNYYCDAFTAVQKIAVSQRTNIGSSDSDSSTKLKAGITLIIAPMLKKMRDDAAKKRMPSSADRDEAIIEAPGLRVGRNVWKWPPYWPYDDSIFKSKFQLDIDERNQKLTSSSTSSSPASSMNDMMAALSGIQQQIPTIDTSNTNIVLEKDFDSIQYWNSEQLVTQRTELDVDAVEKLMAHYEYYIQPGSSILEFGASDNSYLPSTIKPSRHVGISANEQLMNANPSLTDKLVIDLNKVIPGRDIDSDVLRTLASTSDQFDIILMANTVEYLCHPREVFRTAWYLLKPGGRMIVSFSGKDATINKKFNDCQTKIWREYNDDQHLWITGSFFHFSAGDGWENLLGFDISPDSAKKVNDNIIEATIRGAKNNQYFVVQATKGFQYTSIDNTAVEESISSLCWMLPIMEDRDKSLTIPRLTKIYETCTNNVVRQAIERNLQYLPTIYEVLVKMDTFAFTFSMQSQLAAELVSNPEFDPTKPEQIIALKQGLGLRTPNPEFWIPVGINTDAMLIEDRINLLGYVVPKFGSNNPLQEIAIEAFVNGLVPTINLIKSKVPSMSNGNVQLVATELLASEILTINKSTPKEFAIWLDCMTRNDYESIVTERERLRELASSNYEAYRIAKVEEQQRIANYKRQYEEQITKARAERTLIFNPRTQKMQIFDNPNIKKQEQEKGGNFITNLFPKK